MLTEFAILRRRHTSLLGWFGVLTASASVAAEQNRNKNSRYSAERSFGATLIHYITLTFFKVACNLKDFYVHELVGAYCRNITAYSIVCIKNKT